jgi:hypothetical protein
MGHEQSGPKRFRSSVRSAVVCLAIVGTLLINYGAVANPAWTPTPFAHSMPTIKPGPTSSPSGQLAAAWGSIARGNGPGAAPTPPSCRGNGGVAGCHPAFTPGPPLPSPGPWLNITTLSSVSPGARACYAMAYDAVDQYVVLFAGCVPTGGQYGDTWTYSHGVWSRLAIAGPSNRTYSMMAYDAADQYVVLYGGQVGSNAVNDTWKYHAGVWTQIKVTVFPKPREAAGMAYDAHDGYIVLFGGYSTNNFADLKDTWTYKAGNWTTYVYNSTTLYPSARQSPAMAYDPNNQSVVLFGGLSASKGTFMSDTWTFQTGNWTKVNATVFPSARESSAMEYDPLLGHVLLFGGDALSGGLKDMWAWLGNNWTVVNATQTPTKRTLMSIVWDTIDGYGVLFGGAPTGASRAYYSDTWTLGLNLTSSVSVAPNNIDLGETSTFRGAAVGASSYFSYLYTGLPTGCSTLNVTLLTCKPTGTAQSYKVMLTVTDNQSRKVYANTTLSVWNGPQISAFTVQPGAISLGQPVWFNTTATGGVGVYKYLYFGPTGLPSGCATHNLSSFTCVPRAKGNFTLNVTVTDSLGGHNNATSGLVINPDPAVASFSAAASQIDLGQSAAFSVNATGGTGGLTYVYSGLPLGCSSTNAATLNCQPTQTGTFNITVLVTDKVGYNASRGTSITINADPVIASYKVAPAALDLGQAVTFAVNASHGTGSLIYTYSGLPKGCVTANVSFFGCTPTVAGNFTVTVDVTDLASWLVSSSATFFVRADPAVSSFSAAPAQLDLGQSLVLKANISGGSGGFTYSYSGLPLGCVLANAPQLNCTPTASGAYVVHLTVRDSAGKAASGTTSVSIQPDLAVVAFSISPGVIEPGTNTSFSVVVKAGTGARTYSYGGLPTGCTSVDSLSFFCFPSSPGRFNVSVQVTDAAQFSVMANATLVVNKTSTGTGTGTSGSSGALSTTDIAIIGAVVVLAAIAAIALMLRRRGPPATGAQADEEGGSEDGGSDEALYGAQSAPTDDTEPTDAEPPYEPEPEPEPEAELVNDPPMDEEPLPEGTE